MSSAHPYPSARAQLQRRVAWHLVRGATVAYEDEMTTVLAYRQQVKHKAHRTAALYTLGLWAPFWGLYTLTRRARPRGIVIMIDKYGLVHEEGARRRSASAAAKRARSSARAPGR